MQAMREVLRGGLGRSLRTLSDEDRLAAAWVVACGPALAARAEVLGLDDDRVLHIRVLQPGWREQFAQMRAMLTDDLRKIAGVRLQAIHFEGQGFRKRDDGNAQAGKRGSTGERSSERRDERDDRND